MRTRVLFVLLLASSLSACTQSETRATHGRGLTSFRSEAELGRFLRRAAVQRMRLAWQFVGMAASEGYGSIALESVTNVQHAGIDEGGIVKVHGDHLVMLRRGRLFTVRIRDGGLEPVSAIDAFAPGIDAADSWYDELLVSGNDVVVLGYNYDLGTEIGRFRIDADGRLEHHATYHLRSNDYYSSRNYASRLIGTKLILYAPLSIFDEWRDVAAELPAMRRWHPGATDDEFRPIISATRVYRPGRNLGPLESLALHTVTTCDLAQRELACEATALLGPHGRVFYVSPSAVYVWLSDWEKSVETVLRSGSVLYRIPLDGAAPTALNVDGSPVDQFSFLESDDGHINVLVMDNAFGDWMWAAEAAHGDIRLLRVPLTHFSNGNRVASRFAYRRLPRPKGDDYAFHNRFVGRHLLYGIGSGWGPPDSSGSAVLYVVPWAGGSVSEVPLPHDIDRIDGMGADAVVIGTEADDLHFTGIQLAARPRAAQQYVRKAATQGELRSHGFFYRPDGADSGVLGLPIRAAGQPGYLHLDESSASLLFLRNEHAQFLELGELAALRDTAYDDGCVASCVDWYGNSRPLFLHGRIFALLGYEIVEGAVQDGRIHEVRRVSFAPRSAEPRPH